VLADLDRRHPSILCVWASWCGRRNLNRRFWFDVCVELAALFGFFAMYIVVGVVGVALTALLYHHVEVVKGKTYEGTANLFAWVHFLLMNIGIAGATWPMIYAGFWGDIALGQPSQGGLGWTLDQVAAQILARFLMPVGLGLLLAGIGAVAGMIGFLITGLKR
jgi:hypothetical protein